MNMFKQICRHRIDAEKTNKQTKKKTTVFSWVNGVETLFNTNPLISSKRTIDIDIKENDRL